MGCLICLKSLYLWLSVLNWAHGGFYKDKNNYLVSFQQLQLPWGFNNRYMAKTHGICCCYWMVTMFLFVLAWLKWWVAQVVQSHAKLNCVEYNTSYWRVSVSGSNTERCPVIGFRVGSHQTKVNVCSPNNCSQSLPECPDWQIWVSFVHYSVSRYVENKVIMTTEIITRIISFFCWVHVVPHL